MSGASKDTASHTRKSLSKLYRPKADGICLTVWLDEAERVHKFELSGHAGYAAAGEDIVCAGVSALGIAAVNGLEHFLAQPPAVNERAGYLMCELPPVDEDVLEQAQWILRTMQMGIEQIQQTYGNEYIKIERRRCTPC